ncbi:MAG TPA: hypothetical protein VG869_05675 [Acidimicrobiia bacterium]|nr:hypothetical protein [Acidimicrobiia bacterium]
MIRWGAVLAAAAVVVATAAPAAAARPHSTGGGTYVYWDQNEEEQVLTPSGHVGLLVPPYDPNGQMCIFPDRSGRFVTGYNPTLPGQHNPGSRKPIMNPPVGEAVWDRHGRFTGRTIAVPGPYANPGSKVGGDIPPDQAAARAFNNNGTYTGCTFDRGGNLLAADLGTAQGAVPVPDNGRLIEWFAPRYTDYCILVGPTQGGVGAHHVDGTGGLRDPGQLVTDAAGNVYLAESGGGRVLEFLASSVPTRAQQCGPDNQARPPVPAQVFTQGRQAFPLGIARDPTCQCWAVGSVIGDPAVAWYDDHGQPAPSRPPVPTGPYSPFGVAVAPDGTLYIVDIHVACTTSGCGPVTNGGQVLKVPVVNGVAQAPVPVVGGLNFPTSVTVCTVTAKTVCPSP